LRNRDSNSYPVEKHAAMIISLLGRATLAAAAVAALSIPAAAQRDAAFASAIGKLPSGLETTAQLKTQSQVPLAQAQPQGPAATDAAWRKVMELIRLKGERIVGNVDYQRVTGWIGNLDDVHTTYTATVFLTDVAGEPVAHSAALGITKFTPIADTDRFQTAGWQLMLTPTGRLTEAHYSEHTGNRTIGFTQVKAMKLASADPVVKARFDEVLTYWIAR